MLPFWDDVIEPLLKALGGGPVIEIGAASGETTTKLAELAAAQGTELHSIDPEPQFDVGELARRFDRHLCFYRARSHDVLEEIGPAAAVLVDGDHNWYTVHGELTRLEQIADAHDRHFPLVMLHDLEWPYGRRDMYYDPQAIPDRWRRPWARRGIVWGRSALGEEEAGVNPHLANALEEGGPENGVLTAVEDFVASSEAEIELRIVHGHAGLGVLASADLLDADEELRAEWDRLRSPRFLLEQTQRLAATAARATATGIVARRKLARLTRGDDG